MYTVCVYDINGNAHLCVCCVQTPGFALALGLTVHGLSSCGHGKTEDLLPRLLSAWTKILLAEVLFMLEIFKQLIILKVKNNK